MKRKLKRKLRKKVLEMSEGLLASLTDLILVFFNYSWEVLKDPQVARSLPRALYKMDRRMQKVNYLTIKRAIKNATEKGWIKELEVTEDGQKRLKTLFREYSPPFKWSGNWYLVNFDIPEKMRWKRDLLRKKLKESGFGKLQDSIWICPFDLLGEVEKILKEYSLTPYVILSISDKVGRIGSKRLAEKIWKISEIQEEYRKFISEFEEKENPSPVEVAFRYQSILEKDPQLPKELLSDDWPGEEAYKLYLEITKK
jgi:phenylacetic acid degradation operon negative regulatory protein